MVFGSVYTIRIERSRKVAVRLVNTAMRQPVDIGYTARALTKVPSDGKMKEVELSVAQWPATSPGASDGRLRITGALPDGHKVDYNSSSRQRGIIPGGRGADRERLLRRNYVPVYAGESTIGGRKAEALILRSRLPNRPELTVWIDRKTGLALGWRKISARRTLAAETRLVDLRIGTPEKAPPPMDPNKKKRFPLTLEQARKLVGFTPLEPKNIPDGYQLVGYGAHDCHCGCGMQSATLRYSDGVGAFTVFETDDPKHTCHAAGLKKFSSKSCTSGSLDGDTVAGMQRGNICVAVVGDLSDRDAKLVALTVPASAVSSADGK